MPACYEVLRPDLSQFNQCHLLEVDGLTRAPRDSIGILGGQGGTYRSLPRTYLYRGTSWVPAGCHRRYRGGLLWLVRSSLVSVLNFGPRDLKSSDPQVSARSPSFGLR